MALLQSWAASATTAIDGAAAIATSAFSTIDVTAINATVTYVSVALDVTATCCC